MRLNVDGTTHEVDVEEDMPLLWVLRDEIGIKGVKYGCGIAQCGACTVHMDGKAVKSCTVLAGQADGAEVVTIEGIGDLDNLHPMQSAFRDCHALQCGFCTPGMIMRSIELVNTSDNLDNRGVREGLEGNICRCTGYHNIVRAVLQAADEM